MPLPCPLALCRFLSTGVAQIQIDGFRSPGRVAAIAKGMRTPMRIQTRRHHTKCAIAAASKVCRLRVSRETRVRTLRSMLCVAVAETCFAQLG
eukprot:COSAG06_NODE_4359_length_4331_cov_7.796078_4_plen_93_part_00